MGKLTQHSMVLRGYHKLKHTVRAVSTTESGVRASTDVRAPARKVTTTNGAYTSTKGSSGPC